MSQQPMPGYFFMPQHIVLVGASERPHSLGERILTSLLSLSFQGKVTPINLHHKTVAGLTAYANLNKVDDSADLVIAVTPPESYEALFKACRKKHLANIILVQDWETLPLSAWLTTAAVVKKYHGKDLNISVCNPAGVQLPTQGLNIGILPDFPAGHVALLTGEAAISLEIDLMLRRMRQGISRHISLNYELSPTVCADWLNRFGHNRHTKVAVIHLNPLENQRKLFSAIRHFARHTPIIVHCTHKVDDTEKAVLNSLSRHCGFLPTFSSDELEAALQAHLSDLKSSPRLTVLSNTPPAKLSAPAQQLGIELILPSAKPRIQNGYIGSMPTATHFRSLVTQYIQHNETQALLAIIAPNAEHNEAATAQVLRTLSSQTNIPILISSRFSDGLLHFDRPEQALQTLHMSNTLTHLRQLQSEIAPAKSGRLKNIEPEKVLTAITEQNFTQLAQTLHLPLFRSHPPLSLAQLTCHEHPRYGVILTVKYQGSTMAVLPPFTTLDEQYLLQIPPLQAYRSILRQFLHSMNQLEASGRLLGKIILHVGSHDISSQFQLSETVLRHSKPVSKPSESSKVPAATPGNHGNKIQSAAEFIRSRNAAAAKFIRHTSEAAAGLWNTFNEHPDPIPENVLAPYPRDYPHTLCLKNGTTVTIRPFEPEDAQAKQQFIRELSPQARYTRFMTATNELPLPTLARFSKLDYSAEGAWIAENSDGRMVAVSRFSRLNRDECEFGITLADTVRGTGLAHEMMQLIIRLATQQGYRSMNAEILKENVAMLKLAEKSGFTLIPSDQDNRLYQAKLNLFAIEDENKSTLPQ